MIMKERLYIQSHHLCLIKQLIDYSLFHETFTVEGISMSTKIDVDEINRRNISIYILDEGLFEKDSLIKLKDISNIIKDKDIAIIYICDQLNENTQAILNSFTYQKIMVNNYNIYYLLDLIFQIYHERKDDNNEYSILFHLKNLSIKESLKGFHYMKRAISLKMKDENIKMYTICDKIAREYHVTSSRVERCMRTSIENSYKYHNDAYKVLYGMEEKPGCMHLICRIVEEVNRH